MTNTKTRISEHGLKEKYGHDDWQKEFNKINKDINILFHYTCIENKNILSEVNELIQLFPSTYKSLVYEECVEKGGGGNEYVAPTVHQFITYAAIFSLSRVATGFLSEMGKDAYKSTSTQFQKIKGWLKAKNSLSIILEDKNGHKISYLYQHTLSSDQTIEAFHFMQGHFNQIKRRLKSDKKFVYDSKNRGWVEL